MEHRCEQRLAVVAEVAIFYREHYVAACKIQNLSSGGALLEMPMEGLAQQVRMGAVYQLFHEECQELRALVIHRKGRHVGLMFLDELAASPFFSRTDNIAA